MGFQLEFVCKFGLGSREQCVTLISMEEPIFTDNPGQKGWDSEQALPSPHLRDRAQLSQLLLSGIVAS